MKSEIDILVEELLASVQPEYPKDHVAGMRVPKGGSSCAKCEYLADNQTDCTNEYFQKWNGGPVIPGKIDEYCSDWFESKEDLEAAGTSEGVRKAWDTRGRGRHANPHRPGSAIRRLMDLAQRPQGININEAMGKLGVQRWVLSFVRNGEGNGFRWQVIDNGQRSGVLKVGAPTPTPASAPTPSSTPTVAATPRVNFFDHQIASGPASMLGLLRDGEWHTESEVRGALRGDQEISFAMSRINSEGELRGYKVQSDNGRYRVALLNGDEIPRASRLTSIPSTPAQRGPGNVPPLTRPTQPSAPTAPPPAPSPAPAVFDPASVPKRIENPPPGQRQPVGFLTKDPATFGEVPRGPGRVSVDDKNKFQAAFKMSPDQFKNYILKGVPENLANASVTLNSSYNVWQLSVNGPGWSMSRSFNFQDKSVYHGYFSMNENLQGKGLGKTMFTNLFDVYDHLGMKTVGVSASLSNGGYAWARFGFIPNASDWSSVASNALHRSERDSSLTPDIKAQVRLIAKITDPKAIWLLAGLKDAKGESVGGKLLRGQDWHGKIDLNNPEQYAVVRDYSGRKKA